MAAMRRLVAAMLLALPLLAGAQSAEKPFSNEQLDQMLAQIALYPDSLLSQVLMASTYPTEFAEAAAWSKAHPDTKGEEAVKQVADKDWDTSVASLVAFPEVLITLGDKPDYVKNLGDAFLAQPDEVMDSAQRLRAAAQKAGNLKSNEQIKVSTEPAPPEAPKPAPAATSMTTVVQAPPVTQTIVIEPAKPEVVYVPAYNPAVVYGTWWYPSYPPYYYPPPPGYWFSRGVAAGISWGVGFAVGNALWGGFDWNDRDIDIDIERHNNINVNKRIDVDSRHTKWSHNSEHRKTAYRGGDAQRQRLDQRRAATSRESFHAMIRTVPPAAPAPSRPWRVTACRPRPDRRASARRASTAMPRGSVRRAATAAPPGRAPRTPIGAPRASTRSPCRMTTRCVDRADRMRACSRRAALQATLRRSACRVPGPGVAECTAAAAAADAVEAERRGDEALTCHASATARSRVRRARGRGVPDRVDRECAAGVCHARGCGGGLGRRTGATRSGAGRVGARDRLPALHPARRHVGRGSHRLPGGVGAWPSHHAGRQQQGDARGRNARLDAADPAGPRERGLALRHARRRRGDAYPPHRAQRAGGDPVGSRLCRCAA
jgi:hypothetical protein